MKLNQIKEIAIADFKERSRRFSFLALATLSVIFAFFAVPNSSSAITSITVDTDYFAQGTTWSWVPMAAALCIGILLPLMGFFYVKNSLKYDKETGVSNLINTSPVSKIVYLAGKYLSNIILLFCLLLIVIVSSFCMVLIKFPNTDFPVFQFVSYYISIIPGLFICASIVLLFEAIPFFQTKTGNGIAAVVFLSFYISCITFAMMQPNEIIARCFDISGFSWLKECIDQSVYAITKKPAEIALFVGGGANVNNNELLPLTFLPLRFSTKILIEKGTAVVSGIALCALASIVLPRTEQSAFVYHNKPKSKNYKAKPHGVLLTELLLTFRGCSFLWYFVMILLWILLLIVPIKTAQNIMLPLTLIWSTILFSDYGCREKTYFTDELMKTIPLAYPKQLMIRWCMGSASMILIIFPVILRTVFNGEIIGMCSGISWAMFVPALSIFLGQISGTERLFEIVFLAICYVMLNSPALILSLAAGETSVARCVFFAILTVLMMITAYFLRTRTADWRQ